MKFYRLLFTLIIAYSILFTQQIPLLAAEQSSMLFISPSFHKVNISEQEERKTVFTKIKNTSSQDLTIQLSVVDINQINGTGRMTLVSANKNSLYSLKKYITFPEETFALKAQEAKTVPVIINSSTMNAGGYYGAIVFEARGNNESVKKSGAVHGISTLLFITKTGDIKPAISVKQIITLKSNIQFSYPNNLEVIFTNKGNVDLIPYGRIEIYDPFNRLLSKGVLNDSSDIVLPGVERTIVAKMDKTALTLPFSLNKVIIYGQDSQKITSYTYSSNLLYFNPIFLLIILLLFIASFVYRNKIYTCVINSVNKFKKKKIIKSVS